MNILGSVNKFVRERFVKIDFMSRPSIRYGIENKLLPSLLARTPCNSVREVLNLPVSAYQTQLNQDVFALLMNQFRTGYFLEIGANDGFTLSNTVYLEECFNWEGTLIEANPKYLESLTKRKKSVVVNKAVSAQKGKAEFVDAGLYGGLKSGLDASYIHYTQNAASITVECMSLQEILDSVNAPKNIDFVSIDVEGGEVPIVEQMVSVDRRFKCGCVEYNAREADYERIVTLLNAAQYKVIWKNQTEHDLFFIDDLKVV